MQHTVHFNHLRLPWVVEEAWQQTADTVFKSLAINGCLKVHLQARDKHQAALQAGHALAWRMFGRKAGAQALSAPGVAVWSGGLGCEEVLTYRSGPWPSEGALACEQHKLLHKVHTNTAMLRINMLAAASCVTSLVTCCSMRNTFLAACGCCRPWQPLRTCALHY